jgi:hypothetical protein
MTAGLTRCTPRITVRRAVQPVSSDERLTARTPVCTQAGPRSREDLDELVPGLFGQDLQRGSVIAPI